MSIERILQDQKLIQEITRRLERGGSGPAMSLPPDPRGADEVRRAAENANRGLESTLASSFLEAVIRREGRPVFFIQSGQIKTPDTGVWAERIASARVALEIPIPAVGRIDLGGSPDRRIAGGTGWLVAPDVVLTNRHVALQFAGQAQGGFVFNVNPNNEPMQVSVDFAHEYQQTSQRSFEVIGVIHIEPSGPNPDVALLQVRERDRDGGTQPVFVRLADTDPQEGALVGVVGYAAADPVLTPQDVLASIFGNVYDVKRFHPGETLAPTRRDLTHDCSTLGGNSGSVVLDFSSGKAVGLHYQGFFEKQNYAIPASRLLEILHRLKIEIPAAVSQPSEKKGTAPMSSTPFRIKPVDALALESVMKVGLESPMNTTNAKADLPPESLRELVALVGEAKQKIYDAHDTETDLGGSPEDATAALLQSWLAENAAERARIEGLGGEIPLDERDLRWGLSLLSWLRGLKKHELLRPTKGPEPLPDRARIALLGDWGSGRYSAPKVGQTVGAGAYDVAIHLGDVYYAGTEREVRDNFLRYWPLREGMLSRALNSNHEMYSGGYGYFNLTLPRFGQEASYFALRNEHFLLIGLDTGYNDHDLDPEQLGWLKATIAEAGTRKVIMLSHHQLYTAGEGPAKNLAAKVGPMLDAGKVFAWYWGHEHVAAVFDYDPTFRFYGRCIGHGGFPYFRYSGDAATSEGLLGSRWRLIAGNNKTPNAMQLDDPNPDVAPNGDPERYGAQGFASLELDGPSLVERVHRPDGSVIYEKRLP